MRARTKATLSELEQVEWFYAVGQNDSNTDAVIFLSSWEDAVKRCSSSKWENLLLEAANRYREQLFKSDLERYIQWNIIVDKVKPVTAAVVERKIAAVVKRYNLPKAFQDIVHWDILHLAMEAEYSDVYPPGFYASQAFWYVNGHFPCGWKGRFPNGKLIIY